MENNNKNAKWALIAVIIIFVFAGIVANSVKNSIPKRTDTSDKKEKTTNTLKIISSQENEELEDIIQDYAKQKGYNVQIDYGGTIEIVQKLNKDNDYDAAWLSNSIWGYMLDSKTISLSNSKCTSINPVIFGIKKSKAQELGLVGKTVTTQDILNNISSGKLKFSMSNPTSTNSGATAYLGLLSTLAGNPEVLTEANLEDANVKSKLKTTFSAIERTSGDEDFLESLFLNGDYEAVFTYESSIININKKLEEQGKETLYAIYPIDGVSISDSPLSYIDRKNENKKAIFKDIQSYILSDEGQQKLQEKGRRTWYGGISTNVDKTVFNPNWGIDTTKYITPLKFPSTEVIKTALTIYQTELRKPVHQVFCLDYSGSMYGEGIEELRNAMQYILTDESKNDFIQFSNKDKIDVLKFATKVSEPWSTLNGTQTQSILNNINTEDVEGSTAIYPACIKALELLKNEDQNTYSTSIILMTDGIGNVGKFKDLRNEYKQIGKEIPIYSIMFGDAEEYQLQEIANLTNGKVFNGKTDLIKAFKEVRGYN